MTSPNFATVAPKSSATPLEEVDELVSRLVRHKAAWVRTPIARRVELLEQCIVRTEQCAEDWVRAASRAVGVDPEGPLAGEAWLSGPVVLIRNLRLLAESLQEGGQPAPSGIERRGEQKQQVVRVFPDSFYDSVLYGGVTADVWIQPGRPATQGRIYREKAEGQLGGGKVALVLAAGNIGSIGPMDILYKLFAEDEVVVCKTNPVNAYLQPFWEVSLRPLILEGVLGIVRGGAKVGKHLCRHPEVDTIHITGSNHTHDAIVWGDEPKEQKRRKASGEPALDKPITSELGCVTPVMVVPGDWSDDDLDYQARHVASMVAHNASFNCNAAKVLVLADRWAQREVFLEKVEKHLAATPPRYAYYPGAQERYDEFLARYPDAEPLGPRSERIVPWTIIPDVPPKRGEPALTDEAFCGVLATTRLKAADPAAFMDAMVEFANHRCWGTLSCVILIDPATARSQEAKLESAIGALRYGGIGVNAWPGMIYALGSPTWGAFPGHALTDIRSGRGVVHNTFLFDHPEKSVVRAPFRSFPKLPYFVDHKSADKLGRALARFEAKPGLARLPDVIFAAMKG